MGHTPLGRELHHEAELFAEKIFDKFFKKGYSIREIEQVLCGGIHQKAARTIVEKRRHQLLDQGFDKPEDYEEHRRVRSGSELPKGVAE